MPVLNKLIHERARLLILTYLAGNGDREISFGELQSNVGLTAGNLSIQLKRLKEAGYVSVHKTFKNNKPFTSAAVTVLGTAALSEYLDEMEMLIKGLKREGK